MKNKVNAFIVLIITFLFSLLAGGQFAYLLFFLAAAIIIFSFYTVKNYQDKILGIFWVSNYQVEKGDTIEIHYKVYNSSIMPIPYIKITDGIPKRLTDKSGEKYIYSILPFESLIIRKKFECKHRGNYQIGEIDVEAGDIFGIFNKRFKVKDNLIITVYPKIYNLDAFNIYGKEFFGKTSANLKFYEDYSSIKDMRKYEIGDSLKRVNWKVTAKKGELFVKNYDVSSNAQVHLFMDFQWDKFKNDAEQLIEEKIIECVMSIVHFALYRNIDINFITYVHQKVKLSGRDISRFDVFLELSTRIRPSKNINLGDVILNEIRTVSLGSTVIIVTPYLDSNLASAALVLRRMGYIVNFIVINDFDKNKWINKDLHLLEKMEVKIYRIDLNDDLNVKLR